MSAKPQRVPRAMQPSRTWPKHPQQVRMRILFTPACRIMPRARQLTHGVHADVVVQVPMNDERRASPPSRAVRMTRRQLAKVEEQLSKSQRMLEPPAQPETPVAEEQIVNAPTVEPVAKVHEEEPIQEEPVAEIEIQEESAAGVQEEPVAQVPEEEAAPVQPEHEVVAQEPEPEAPAPTISIPVSDPEPKTLTSSKPGEDSSASTPITSRAPSRSPSKSPAKTPMRLEQSIEAIDALEEALENINKTIPVFDHSADDKSPRKAQFDANARTATPNTRSTTAKVSRNPSVVPKSLKPTSHASKISAPRNSLVRSASTRVASTTRDADAKVRKGSGEVVDYLAAKRRPISMSFPAPPPPVKSSKPPTKPTFQLPGEAVAAKLKAQREERLKREEEEAAARKAASFKARPAPVRKNVPAVNMVRQTASSKARENLMNGKPTGAGDKEKENKNAPGVSIPPPNPKRMSSIILTSTLSAPSTTSTTCTTTSSKRLSTTLTHHPSSRPTFSSSTSHAPSSLSSSISLSNPVPGSKTTVSAAEQAAQRLKAREIFNRDKLEKEAREKERREKEDAAKRARAEAAERGRIASREWAERQKMKVKKFVTGKGEGEKVEQA
ncbi:hypothetical protein BCR34DRAFT_332847 [Clohesyomyces aquaticus]|uniref:Uncharacterized protein n=1 Tax=Clohesyomyces aquaticus TaxID=1231657 RepID=A0A1Y1ZLN6_9PLEO|nr:hypothetical protein BCR34DRAFT_332847 [Clohesyomyces aquaticus]